LSLSTAAAGVLVESVKQLDLGTLEGPSIGRAGPDRWRVGAL